MGCLPLDLQRHRVSPKLYFIMGYGFLFRSEICFRTTQELEYFFLGYMTKTPPKSEYFFQQHW
jgi:hypothetical protein